jgi:hypothetical protein
MVRMAGDSIEEVDVRGERIVDNTFLLLLNAGEHGVTFTLPPPGADLQWQRALDTSDAHWNRVALQRGSRYRLGGHAMAVFESQAHSKPTRQPDDASSGAGDQ